MRERKILWFLLALNIVLAAAFMTYLFLVTGNPFQNAAGTATGSTQTQAPNHAPAALPKQTSSSQVESEPKSAAPSPDQSHPDHPAQNQSLKTSRKHNWKNITSKEYSDYLENLRAIGCPEEHIRQIILSDIDDLFAQKRLQDAIAFDIEWWHEDPAGAVLEFLQEKGQIFETERWDLIHQRLGANAPQADKANFWTHIQLTGPVLGNLPPAVHQQVQEICARSLQRLDAVAWTRVREGLPIHCTEFAELRDQARAELRKILTDQQLEEFLLRFSQNAQELRAQLRFFGPTPDEFRHIFRAIDPLAQQVQLQYGSLDALGATQRERYERQCQEAIRAALTPERYQAYCKNLLAQQSSGATADPRSLAKTQHR